jgi:hypothetical protein
MRNVKHPIAWMALLLVLILITSNAAAAGPPDAILRHVIASGGQRVAADTLILNGTIGEPAAGPLTIGGDYKAAYGYWWVMARSTRLYLPVVKK